MINYVIDCAVLAFVLWAAFHLIIALWWPGCLDAQVEKLLRKKSD